MLLIVSHNETNFEKKNKQTAAAAFNQSFNNHYPISSLS